MEMHHESVECFLDKTHLFQPAVFQNQVKGSNWEEVDALNLKTADTLKFMIQGNTHFIDLSNTLLELRLKIVEGNGDAIADTANCAPVNCPGLAMFSQLRVKIGDDILATENNYNTAAMMQTEYSLSDSAKRGYLTSSCYVKDTPGQQDIMTAANAGFTARKAMFAGSREVTVYSKVHSGIFNINKLLVNNVDLTLEFDVDKNAKTIMAPVGSTFRLVIVKATIKIRRVELAEGKVVEINNKLTKMPAIYHVPRSIVTTHTIGSGNLTFKLPNFNTGDIPSRIFIALMSSERWSGVYKLNNYKYEHFDLTEVDIKVDGRSKFGRAIKANFANQDYNEIYLNTMQALGQFGGPFSNDLSYNDFGNGHTLIGCELTSSFGEDAQYRDPIKTGNMELQLTFATALNEAVDVIIYRDFENSFEINSDRKISKDW